MATVTDAKRWVGKASIASGTDKALRERLEEVHGLIEDADAADSDGEYKEAAEKMHEAVQLAEKLVDAPGWAESGYDYEQRMRDESLPAMKELVENYKNRAAIDNL